LVDVAAVTERNHDDEQDVILDRVDDPVVDDAHAEARSPLEGLRPRRAQILTEQCDRPTDPVAIPMVDLLQRTNRCRPQLKRSMNSRHFEMSDHVF